MRKKKKASRFSLCCIYTRKPWNWICFVTACLSLSFFFFWNLNVNHSNSSGTSRLLSQCPLKGEIWNCWCAFNKTNHRFQSQICTAPYPQSCPDFSRGLGHQRPAQRRAGAEANPNQLATSFKKKKAPRSKARQCHHSRWPDRFYLATRSRSVRRGGDTPSGHDDADSSAVFCCLFSCQSAAPNEATMVRKPVMFLFSWHHVKEA